MVKLIVEKLEFKAKKYKGDTVGSFIMRKIYSKKNVLCYEASHVNGKQKMKQKKHKDNFVKDNYSGSFTTM